MYFMVSNGPMDALIQVLAGLVKVASHDIDTIPQAQAYKICDGDPAMLTAFVGVLVVNVHAHDSPQTLLCTSDPSAGNPWGRRFGDIVIRDVNWLGLWVGGHGCQTCSRSAQRIVALPIGKDAALNSLMFKLRMAGPRKG